MFDYLFSSIIFLFFAAAKIDIFSLRNQKTHFFLKFFSITAFHLVRISRKAAAGNTLAR